MCYCKHFALTASGSKASNRAGDACKKVLALLGQWMSRAQEALRSKAAWCASYIGPAFVFNVLLLLTTATTSATMQRVGQPCLSPADGLNTERGSGLSVVDKTGLKYTASLGCA